MKSFARKIEHLEALILTLDVACVTYLAWKLFKLDEKSSSHPDLGWFSYKKSLNK